MIQRQMNEMKKDRQVLLNYYDTWVYRNNQILNILDEVDALMTPKKSFEYSVGGC